jgi:3-hydroxybutyryl-CoA dehydrogenase
MSYQIIAAGDSQSFPDKHALINQAASNGTSLIYIGQDAAEAFANSVFDHEAATFIAIELGNECRRSY